MTENTISVIIPCYNAEKYIQQCYEQIIKQTYTDLDIIFINDGSTDKTKMILTSLAEKDNRIRLINQENKGVSVARNAGLDLVSNTSGGGYISFLDIDDELEAEYFEVLIQDIKEHNADIVACHFKEKDAVLNSYYELNLPKYNKLVSGSKEIYESFFRSDLSKDRFLISVWAKLFTTNVVADVYFDKDLKKGEDMLFVMNLAYKKSPKIWLEDKSLYIYNHYNRLVARKNSDGVHCYCEIYQMALDLGCDLKKSADKYFSIKVLSFLIWLVRENSDLYQSKSLIFKEWACVAIKSKNISIFRRLLLRMYIFNPDFFRKIIRLLKK